jgi:hypothetical protein
VTGPLAQQFARLRFERESWEPRCHFCSGPCFPWLTDDETWAKVEPMLGQHQACFECFSAAWFALGLNDGEPFQVRTPAALSVIERHVQDMETALNDKPGQPVLNAARALVRATDNAERNAALGDLHNAFAALPASETPQAAAREKGTEPVREAPYLKRRDFG